MNKLSFDKVSKHFDKTLALACKELEVSTTTLKKFCRINKIGRWPYRKIRGIERHLVIIRAKKDAINDVNSVRYKSHAEKEKELEDLKKDLYDLNYYGSAKCKKDKNYFIQNRVYKYKRKRKKKRVVKSKRRKTIFKSYVVPPAQVNTPRNRLVSDNVNRSETPVNGYQNAAYNVNRAPNYQFRQVPGIPQNVVNTAPRQMNPAMYRNRASNNQLRYPIFPAVSQNVGYANTQRQVMPVVQRNRALNNPPIHYERRIIPAVSQDVRYVNPPPRQMMPRIYRNRASNNQQRYYQSRHAVPQNVGYSAVNMIQGVSIHPIPQSVYNRQNSARYL